EAPPRTAPAQASDQPPANSQVYQLPTYAPPASAPVVPVPPSPVPTHVVPPSAPARATDKLAPPSMPTYSPAPYAPGPSGTAPAAPCPPLPAAAERVDLADDNTLFKELQEYVEEELESLQEVSEAATEMANGGGAPIAVLMMQDVQQRTA